MFGCTSIFMKKASSCLSLLKHLERNIYHGNDESSIPADINYYTSHFTYKKKTALLILLSTFGYNRGNPSLVNDLHVGNAIIRFGFLRAFNGKLSTVIKHK